jgi:dUTP pyrophosphatase
MVKVKGREFKLAVGWNKEEVRKPERSTVLAAGYDFYAAEEVTIVPIWRAVLSGMTIAPQKVHTGVRANMEEDEVLMIYNRSSNPIKRRLLLALGVGVVDADYYNTGYDISFDFWNFGLRPMFIEKGDKIGQGVFQKFLKVNDEVPVTRIRTGGNGSTDVDE